ncbi:calcium/sodium antiporter [Owenweeksia hongkongensis]|uniref:K+dependent Na+ exchanger related-protein n=1 Tax=Owenweeksia hongkongensis (strain DSM 17368 / CIP 108786 / JCM 12287 / NRRL B-23963 / UST20020801) TaxID=926562 RepID=G8R859_OWEHD|nr:calcium/sodium antiporter [Owenweeksia hongkongensis]AEV32427.1 K+dependent Na+ exchanger related-protein [Owenweeksia hongkongensis DSM 17368]
MSYLYLFGGILLLLFGGDWLVRGAVDLALRLKISILVVGMTVVSFATSAPELLVSLDAAMEGYSDLSFGNVIGSNIANIALILGLTSMVFPMTVKQRTYRVDYWIMMFVTLILFLFLFFDNVLTTWEAAVLVLILIVYNVYQIWASRRINKQDESDSETSEEISGKLKSPWWMVFYLVIGVAALKFGSEFLITGAMDLARQWGVSERIIAVTIVSVGTSLPELAASMVASFKGEQELSLGNLVGSNIFNILAVLGITGLVIDLPVKSDALITFDFPYLFGISLLLYPFIRIISKGKIERWEGFVMLLAYCLYIYLVF